AAPAPWKPVTVKDEGETVRKSFAAMVEAYQKGDRAGFEERSRALRAAVEESIHGWDAGQRRKILAEYVYNHWHPFLWGWVVYLLASLAWIGSIAVRRNARNQARWKLAGLSLTWLASAIMVSG